MGYSRGGAPMTDGTCNSGQWLTRFHTDNLHHMSSIRIVSKLTRGEADCCGSLPNVLCVVSSSVVLSRGQTWRELLSQASASSLNWMESSFKNFCSSDFDVSGERNDSWISREISSSRSVWVWVVGREGDDESISFWMWSQTIFLSLGGKKGRSLVRGSNAAAQ